MPGVLVLEGMAQTAGTLCIRSLPGQTKPALVYFLTIDKAKFRKPVVPGDMLEYHMNRIKRRREHVVVPRRSQGRRRDRGRGRARRHDRRGLKRAADRPHRRAWPTARSLPTTSRSARSAPIGPQVELRAGVRLLSHVNLAGVTDRSASAP